MPMQVMCNTSDNTASCFTTLRGRNGKPFQFQSLDEVDYWMKRIAALDKNTTIHFVNGDKPRIGSI